MCLYASYDPKEKVFERKDGKSKAGKAMPGYKNRPGPNPKHMA